MFTRRQPTSRADQVLNTDGHAVGLDIGATAVRAAVLTPSTTADGRPAMIDDGSGQVSLPRGAVIDGVVHDQEVVTAAIKQLWDEQRLNCKNVILGTANQQAMVRDLQMPDLDPVQRAKALPYQAKEVVALPIEEVVLDYCQIGPPDPQTEIVRGLLVATPREPVNAAVNAIERAGLRVVRVDLASFASLRSAGDLNVDVEAVVDLGAHLTTVVVHDHGVPKLVRTLARGGEQLTDHLGDRLDLDPVEAEATKRESGLEGSNAEVTRALIEGLRPLVAEVRTSIAYFRANHDGTLIQAIALTGGGSRLRGIASAIGDQIGLPTRVVDPLQHVERNDQPRHGGANTPPSAVAVGLAMGAAA